MEDDEVEISDQSEVDGEKKNQNIRKAYACDDEEGDEGDKVFKKGTWTSTEDAILVDYVRKNGEGNWTAVEINSGLSRSRKSCRLRWKYHLSPYLKKGSFSEEEELRVVELHAAYGNKWARIATELPGRTDHDVKNFWRTKGLRNTGKPVYPSGIVLNHSTESEEFDMLDSHTSGSNHLDLLQEGTLEIPIPNPDRGQCQSHYSLPCPMSSLHEAPPLCSTRRNYPSDSYNSYPFVNASEMTEIPPLVNQHVYSPEVVAEPLVEPSPQSLVGVSPDTFCFGQPLSDVVPGSPDISNYGDFDHSNIFSEDPNSELPPLQNPDACLSSQDTPAADHTLCLNQSSPAHPCQPVHPSPPGSIGHLEDIAYQEKCFPSQITGFSTGIVTAPVENISNASFTSNAFSVHESSAEENHPFDEDAFVAGFLNDNEEPHDTDNSMPDDDVLTTPVENISKASFTSNTFSVHESSAEENQPFDEDAFVAGFLNDNEEPHDTDNSKPDDCVFNSS